MKIFKALTLLFVLLLGLVACKQDSPSTTPLTGTQWQLSGLRNLSASSQTSIDIHLRFEAGGQAIITVGYGARTNQSNGSSSLRTSRENETTLSTSYRYDNGLVRIQPAPFSPLVETLITEDLRAILAQLYTDANLNDSQTLLTFNTFDAQRRFSLQRVGR